MMTLLKVQASVNFYLHHEIVVTPEKNRGLNGDLKEVCNSNLVSLVDMALISYTRCIKTH